MKEVKVKYRSRVDVFGKDLKVPRFSNKTVGTDFVKRYHDVFALLVGLNPCARDLMEYYVNEMNDDNIINTSLYSREDFAKTVEKYTNGEVTYSDSNIKKSIQMLAKRECLIMKSKGVYMVNPQMYFNPRKTQQNRLDSIKMVLEFKSDSRDIKMETTYE